jgi:hypothetical protein
MLGSDVRTDSPATLVFLYFLWSFSFDLCPGFS